MKTRITILASERREFTNKSGKKSYTHIAQCIVHGDKIEVGVCRIPERLLVGYVEGQPGSAAEPAPGDYMAEYGLNINWQTRELEGQMKALTPIGVSASASVKEVVGKHSGKEKAEV